MQSLGVNCWPWLNGVFVACLPPHSEGPQRAVLSNIVCDLAQKAHFGGGCGIMNVLERRVVCQDALPMESKVKIQNYGGLISCWIILHKLCKLLFTEQIFRIKYLRCSFLFNKKMFILFKIGAKGRRRSGAPELSLYKSSRSLLCPDLWKVGWEEIPPSPRPPPTPPLQKPHRLSMAKFLAVYLTL